MTVLTKIATGAAVAAGSPFNGSWTNEQNARVVTTDAAAGGSNTYATAAPGKNQEYASLWPFVFSEIPAGATINSVSVKVQWKVSTTSSVGTLQSTMFADTGAGAPDQTAALSASPGVQRTTEPTADTDDTYTATCTAAQLIQGVWVRVQMLRGNSNTAVTGSLDYIQVTVDYTAPVTTRRARIGWAELEVPNGPRRAQVGWAELEVPNAPRRARIGWAELEVPTAPRRARIGWAELEVPDLVPATDRRAVIGWAELEVPNGPRRARIGWAELEVPTAPRRARIGWAEFEVPDAPIVVRRAQIGWAELEVPNGPRRGIIGWAEFQVPSVGEGNALRCVAFGKLIAVGRLLNH